MNLSIIIVNFNTSQLLRNCLRSVYESINFCNLNEAEVIVVDNGSKDDSCKIVRREFPEIRLLSNKKNLGFASANNQGMREAKGKYILLLNSDTQVMKNSFASLLKEIEKDNKIGVVGGQLRNTDDSIQPSAGYFPILLKLFLWMSFIDDIPYLTSILKPYHIETVSFYTSLHEVDWVTGACFLVPKNVYKKVGGFDEKIFMYGEEVEWCYRIKKAGFRVIYTPSCVVYHHKGGSGGGKEAGIIQEIHALAYFYRKHKPNWQYRALPFFFKFGALLRLLLFGIIERNPKKARLYAQILSMAG